MNITEAYRAMLNGKKVGRIASSHSPTVDRGSERYLFFNGRNIVFKRTDGSFATPSSTLHSQHRYEVLGEAEEFVGERSSEFISTEKLHVLSKYDIDKEDLDVLLERSS